jgi:molecular chaperone GrpE (heat shock protein)
MTKDMGEEIEKKDDNAQVQAPLSQSPNASEPEGSDLAAKLAEAEKQADIYKDLLYRKAAEFENFKKRAEKEFDSLYRGIELIYQKLVKNIEKRGVKSFETVGKEFNVDFHDALLQIPREDVAPHTVLEEIEKGYTLRDKVIRHAKVIVSTSPADGTPAPDADQSVSEHQPQSGKS